MKNVVFDLGGVVVDWSPERLMEEYTGDRAMPVSLFERGFFRKFWPDYDRGTIDQVNIVREMSVFSGRPYARMWVLSIYQTFVAGYSPNTMSD